MLSVYRSPSAIPVGWSSMNAPWKVFAAIAAVGGAITLLFPYFMASPAVAAVTMPVHGEATAATTAGDSRSTDYRVERDSCCAGEN